LSGTAKMCACYPTVNGVAGCAERWTSTTDSLNKVVLLNPNTPSTAAYRIYLDTGLKNIYTLKYYTKDHKGREHSDVVYFDITVCGSESITDKTPG
jgi:hypothetical protein